MGLKCSVCRKRKKRKIVLLLVGLDNAGKTVAGKGLAGEPVNSVVPTVGFSVIHLRYGNFFIKIFDLGGGSSIRGIWQKYFSDVHGVIFVIDASDVTRLDEAKSVFENLISNEKISGKPVLLLANKQDNESALDEIEIVEKLQLELLVNSKQCPTLIECCSAKYAYKSKLDPVIKRGYEWLINYIIRNYDEINARVEKDIQEQEIMNQKLLKQKTEKIKCLNENNSHSVIIEKVIETDYDHNKITYVKSANNSDLTDTPVDIDVNDSSVEPPSHNSVVQLVHQQLMLNTDRKPSFKSKHKTYPMQLYNVKPRSANIPRNVPHRQRRNLKSADNIS